MLWQLRQNSLLLPRLFQVIPLPVKITWDLTMEKQKKKKKLKKECNVLGCELCRYWINGALFPPLSMLDQDSATVLKTGKTGR